MTSDGGAANRTVPSVGAAITTAEVVVRHPRVAPAPLECRSALAQWDRATKHLTIRCGTQTPHRARDDIARALGLRNDQVRAITPDVGGAFGMKASIYPEDIAVAYASRGSVPTGALDRLPPGGFPGRIARTRCRVVGGRMALDAAGRILALQADLTFPLGCLADIQRLRSRLERRPYPGPGRT